jgi:hypothetical protein
MIGWLRTGVGVAMLSAPKVPLRFASGLEPSGTSVLLMRTIGVRDLVVGLGSVAAARGGALAESRRWMLAATASDALDTVVCLASFRAIGKRDAWGAALLSLTFVAADLFAYRARDGSEVVIDPSLDRR